jgi:transcriptional regulator with XRE-family HTH domain
MGLLLDAARQRRRQSDVYTGVMATRARAYPVWRMLRQARRDAGLSQRELAARAGTSQAAINRYESARSLPDLPTLDRLFLACGQRLTLRAEPVDPDSLRQLQESLALSPLQRVERVRRQTALAAAAEQARSEGRVRPLRS